MIAAPSRRKAKRLTLLMISMALSRMDPTSGLKFVLNSSSFNLKNLLPLNPERKNICNPFNFHKCTPQQKEELKTMYKPANDKTEEEHDANFHKMMAELVTNLGSESLVTGGAGEQQERMKQIMQESMKELAGKQNELKQMHELEMAKLESEHNRKQQELE
eukprot:273940_1